MVTPNVRAVLACALGMTIVLSSTMEGPALAGLAQAATQTPPQTPPPTFRAGVDLVAVDVAVVDRNGRPVDDLKPQEFTLKVDGRLRRIVSAEFVSFRVPDDDRTSGDGLFSTNTGRRPGRLIMIVVDEANIRKGSITQIVDAAAAFIDRLSRSDRVALQIIPGAGPVVNFTADHALVKRLLKTAVGMAVEAERTDRVGIAEAIEVLERPVAGPTPPPQSALADLFERECPGEHDQASLERCRRELQGLARVVHAAARSRATATMVGLREIIDRLALTSDPKTIVLITEGVLVGRQFADVSWVEARAAAASVSFYALRVDNEVFDASTKSISPTRRADRDLLIDGLNLLVGFARGTVLPIGSNAAATFARLSLELSGHYLLSFPPDPVDRDGKAHDISIVVSRPGISVRARREFTVDPSTRERPVDERLADALRSPLLLTDFGLQTTTFTYRDVETGKLKLLVSAQIDRTVNPSGDLALAYYVTDRNGRVVASQVEPSLGTPAAVAPGRLHQFTGSVFVDPGAYNLKLAVVDAQGRRGSVEHTFEARLTAVGQLGLGDLMLAVPPGPGQNVRPSVDGRISAETMVGYTELYSEAEPQLAHAALAFEIAASEEGLPMATTAMRMTAGQSRGKRTAEGSLPLSLLAPGRYMARAVVSVDGRVVGRVTRPFVLEHPAPVDPLTASRAGPILGAPDAREAVPAFDRASVLTRPAVGFFLDRLTAAGLPPLPDALAPAVGLARTGRFEEALRIVEKSVADHIAGPLVVGLAYFALGDLQTAVENFGATLREAPTFFPAAFYLGACYAAAGRDRDALVAWRAVPMSEPAGPWAPTVMADALLRLGEPIRMDDHLLLVRAMRAIYEERAAGRIIDSADGDRRRFVRYFDAYRRAGGAVSEAIDGWKRVVDR